MNGLKDGFLIMYTSLFKHAKMAYRYRGMAEGVYGVEVWMQAEELEA